MLQLAAHAIVIETMRFVVIPLSAKSSFVYCQHYITPAVGKAAATASKTTIQKPSGPWTSVTIAARSKPRLDERAVHYVQNTWEKWEKSPTWWKQKTVGLGNRVLERIPYDEYSVKLIPSKRAVLRKIQKEIEDDNNEKAGLQTTHVSAKELDSIKRGQLEEVTIYNINVQYPSSIMTEKQSLEILSRLANNGVAKHWKHMWYALGLAPLTLPLSFLPILPNFPGIYLLYRAWSNWRAWEGSKHLKYLVDSGHLNFEECSALNKVCKGFPKYVGKASSEPERVLLTPELTEQLVKELEASHDLSAELTRAVHQTEKEISKAHAQLAANSDKSQQ